LHVHGVTGLLAQVFRQHFAQHDFRLIVVEAASLEKRERVHLE